MSQAGAPGANASEPTWSVAPAEIDVALLTGGGDPPYAYGLASALTSRGIQLELIASDDLDTPEFHQLPGLTVLNLRGSHDPKVSLRRKILRVLIYYLRLLLYTRTARPKIFHLLWNNKFPLVDRTVLMLYYKLLGKKIVLTVHNENEGWRDSNDSRLNRLTLRVQYRVADHLFVHTERMKRELVADFSIRPSAVTVIPFGINNAVPNTALSSLEARQRLGVGPNEKVILFFGSLAPYKGFEYLAQAFEILVTQRDEYRLIVAGRPRSTAAYRKAILQTIEAIPPRRAIKKVEYTPNEDTELYFKAADLLVLPYTQIYQSGVLFLGFSFGLPAVVADVGSLREDVVEGENGYVCRPRDSVDLARTIARYFSSDLYRDLPGRRDQIRRSVAERHSWDTVSQLTSSVYQALLGH